MNTRIALNSFLFQIVKFFPYLDDECSTNDEYEGLTSDHQSVVTYFHLLDKTFRENNIELVARVEHSFNDYILHNKPIRIDSWLKQNKKLDGILLILAGNFYTVANVISDAQQAYLHKIIQHLLFNSDSKSELYCYYKISLIHYEIKQLLSAHGLSQEQKRKWLINIVHDLKKLVQTISSQLAPGLKNLLLSLNMDLININLMSLQDSIKQIQDYAGEVTGADKKHAALSCAEGLQNLLNHYTTNNRSSDHDITDFILLRRYNEFTKQCKQHLAASDRVLGQHGSWKGILINIGIALTVIGMVAMLVKKIISQYSQAAVNRFALFKSRGSDLLESIDKNFVDVSFWPANPGF